MVCPVGEPGSGKSTFSLGLCHALKQAGVAAEFVPEVIKHDVFTPEGVGRVVSGRFDFRYLRAQHALTRGFLGSAQAIVNAQRVPEERMPAFEALLARFRAEQSHVEHRFVTLDLNLPYNAVGRHQDQATARSMRRALLDTLDSRFDIRPMVLRSADDIRCFTRDLIAEMRPPVPEAKRRRLSSPAG